MFTALLGFFACLGILGLIGVGPAVWAMPAGPRRVAHALGTAPAIGLVIVSLVGFPLVLYWTPVRTWAWPVTATLVCLSLALVLFLWRSHAPQLRRPRLPQTAWASLVLLGLGWLALVSPLAFGGIQYAIYRSNPDDAFLYMSLAESVRGVPWDTLRAGAPLTAANLDLVTALAQASPTALFAARVLNLPMALNKMVVLAWSAEVMGLPVTHAYFAHHLTALATALPLALVLGDLLGLPQLLKYLAAAALALGFWARFVLETDSGFEITAMPVLLLLLLAWMQLELAPLQSLSRSRVLLAAAGAALFALYSPLGLLVVLAAALYYCWGLLQRTLPLRAVGMQAITVIMLAGILLVTGQLNYLARSALNLALRAPGEARFAAPAADLLKADGLAAAWGLPASVLWRSQPLAVQWPLSAAADGLGLVLTGMLVYAAGQSLRRDSAPPARLLFAMLASGAVLALVTLIGDNNRAAGKAFTYVSPLLALGLARFVCHMDILLKPPGQRVAQGILVGWLTAQLAVGLYLPLRRQPNFLGPNTKAESYELGALTQVLDQVQPRLLLVDIPRTQRWMFAYYSMLTFARYPAYFHSGLVIDNNTRFQSLWLSTLPGVPDYAVVLKQADYLGPQRFGEMLAETPELILYRLHVTTTAPFEMQEALYREREKQKPLFPTLQD